jgi:hypothetical protein
VGIVFVVGDTLRRASQAGAKPDPVTEARLEVEPRRGATQAPAEASAEPEVFT